MFSPTKAQKENLLAGAILFLYGLWMLVQSFSFTGTGRAGEPGPVLLPRIISIMIICLSILLLLVTSLGIKKADKFAAAETKIGFSFFDKKNASVIITFALFVFYMFALWPLGFIMSSIIYSFLQMLVLSVRPSKKQLVVFALVSSSVPILAYLLFVNVFTLMLPRGAIW